MVTPYPVMSDDEILAMPVGQVSADKAHLYLWTTDQHLELALACACKWGFDHKHPFIWCKTTKDGRPRIGGGHYGRKAHELCLFCVRGGLEVIAKNVPTWFMAERSQHSAKPDQIFEIAQKLSPGPRLELFSRRQRDGWDAWGNEIPMAGLLG